MSIGMRTRSWLRNISHIQAIIFYFLIFLYIYMKKYTVDLLNDVQDNIVFDSVIPNKWFTFWEYKVPFTHTSWKDNSNKKASNDLYHRNEKTRRRMCFVIILLFYFIILYVIYISFYGFLFEFLCAVLIALIKKP